jgi:hypothetical protein
LIKIYIGGPYFSPVLDLHYLQENITSYYS